MRGSEREIEIQRARERRLSDRDEWEGGEMDEWMDGWSEAGRVEDI